MHSKKIPNKPRYAWVKEIAYQTLLDYGVSNLPVKIPELIKVDKSNSIKIISTEEYAKANSISHDKVLKNLKSKDGAVKYFSGPGMNYDLYLIFYNPYILPKERINWTLAHELGHLKLNHLKDFEETSICRKGFQLNGYNVLESEANFFAKILLAPPYILKQLDVQHPGHLIEFCNISEEAALNCYDYYKKAIKYSAKTYELQLSEKFKPFIKKTQYGERNVCLNCKTKLIIPALEINYSSILLLAREIQDKGIYSYCHICGKKNNTLSNNQKELPMTYDGLRTFENGNLYECPRCRNEEIRESDFCKICGAEIVNRCTNPNCSNKESLPSNSRYCHFCGHQSTYYQNGYLNAWDEYQNTSHNSQI